MGRGRGAAAAAGVLSLLAFSATGLALLSQGPRAEQPALGSESRCAAYGGLPPGWGQERRAGMVRLEGGEFQLGSYGGYPDERPAGEGRTRVAAFWIDQTEVTNAQFASFVQATGYVSEAERQGGAVVFHQPSAEELQARPYAWWRYVQGADWRHPQGPGSGIAGQEARPVVQVTQRDAEAYAHWLGRELPNEAEWEYAAKAGREGEALDRAPRDAGGRPLANFWQGAFPFEDRGEDHHAGLAAVGCYAANAFGLYDTIGNVWEWTQDPYSGPHQPHNNGNSVAAAAAYRQGSQAPVVVIKGGSFLCSPDFCVRYRAASREAQEADLPTMHIGFRTVVRG